MKNRERKFEKTEIEKWRNQKSRNLDVNNSKNKKKIKKLRNRKSRKRKLENSKKRKFNKLKKSDN